MFLAVDVGNTSITFGWYDGEALAGIDRWDVRDDSAWKLPEGRSWKEVKTAAAASVNPKGAERLKRWLEENGGPVCREIGREIPVPVEARVRRPSEVGMDRLLNILAAHRRTQSGVIVVDFGTATTFDVGSPDGAYVGGAIAPGLALGARALHENTALLPRAPLDQPLETIGRDTVSCIQIGVVRGYLGLVEKLLEDFLGELGADTPVLATGGESRFIAPYCPLIRETIPDLTLQGIRLAAQS